MARSLSCPNCGGALTIESAFTTLIVCPFCGSSLFVHDTGVDITGKTAKLAQYPSRFGVSASGKIKGRDFSVLGRIRYQYDQGFWDEWFVQFADQKVGWVVEDEGDLTLVFKSKLTVPVPPFDQISAGAFLQLGDERVFVTEKGRGQVQGAEGQVAMTFPPGHWVQFVLGNAANKALRLFIDADSIILQTGEPLEFNDVVMNK